MRQAWNLKVNDTIVYNYGFPNATKETIVSVNQTEAGNVFVVFKSGLKKTLIGIEYYKLVEV